MSYDIRVAMSKKVDTDDIINDIMAIKLVSDEKKAIFVEYFHDKVYPFTDNFKKKTEYTTTDYNKILSFLNIKD